MIERKDIQGITVFIDHERGEIHFSDKHNIVRISSAFGQTKGAEGLFSETMFGTFRLPTDHTGQDNLDERITDGLDQESISRYEPDDVFLTAAETPELHNVEKENFGDQVTEGLSIDYDELLSSEDIPLIVANIIDTPYSDALLFLNPRMLMDKEELLDNLDGNQDILPDLMNNNFLKENRNGELFFTFKGLVVRSEIEKICSQDKLQYQPKLLLA